MGEKSPVSVAGNGVRSGCVGTGTTPRPEPETAGVQAGTGSPARVSRIFWRKP